MIFKNWMSYIADDVTLTSLVMPGAHNAGSYGMRSIARCQEDDLEKQAEYGVRHFCIRLDTDKKGNVVLAHGPTQGATLESALVGLSRFIRENPSEFLLLDVREYYPQTIVIPFMHKAAPKVVDALIAKYLNPAEWALTDFEHVNKVTMGDVRKSGKRYMLINYLPAYAYSVDVPCILPFSTAVHGARPDVFSRECVKFFDKRHTDGIYWFQTQQTAGAGTYIGLLGKPRQMDTAARPYFKNIITTISETPSYLAQANVIEGDFMTEDYMKAAAILRLNLQKGNVAAGKEAEYEAALAEY